MSNIEAAAEEVAPELAQPPTAPASTPVPEEPKTEAELNDEHDFPFRGVAGQMLRPKARDILNPAVGEA